MTISGSRGASSVVSEDCGKVTFIAECCTNVVVMTKNISSVSMTSINEITLISNSSVRVEPSRMSGPACRGAYRRAFRLRGQLVDQQDRLLLHLDDVIGDAAAEITMKEIRRNRHA